MASSRPPVTGGASRTVPMAVTIPVNISRGPAPAVCPRRALRRSTGCHRAARPAARWAARRSRGWPARRARAGSAPSSSRSTRSSPEQRTRQPSAALDQQGLDAPPAQRAQALARGRRRHDRHAAGGETLQAVLRRVRRRDHQGRCRGARYERQSDRDRDRPAAIEDDAAGRGPGLDAPAHGELGIVGARRAAADGDRVEAGAQPVDVLLRGGTRDPARVARRRPRCGRRWMVASLSATNGREVSRKRCRKTAFCAAALLGHHADLDLDARRRRRRSTPPPAAAGLGSATATTTRLMPAARMIASVHGGCFPWWVHGSSVTTSVAPRARVAGRIERDRLGVAVAELGVPALRRPIAVPASTTAPTSRVRVHSSPASPGELDRPAPLPPARSPSTEPHGAVAPADLPDHPGGDPITPPRPPAARRDGLRGQHRDHADAEVEDVAHLGGGDAAGPLQHLEERRQLATSSGPRPPRTPRAVPAPDCPGCRRR